MLVQEHKALSESYTYLNNLLHQSSEKEDQIPGGKRVMLRHQSLQISTAASKYLPKTAMPNISILDQNEETLLKFRPMLNHKTTENDEKPVSEEPKLPINYSK